jgi:hypothetical protein
MASVSFITPSPVAKLQASILDVDGRVNLGSKGVSTPRLGKC